ncbi:MAG: tetratricopeptide repeat protein [Pseudomonadota bacterium]
MFFKPKALPSALTAAGLLLASSVTPLGSVYAQSAEVSVRVIEMEERIRSLNGKVEELTFQLLQMQEQLRKMQEDNELRFQELEEKSSSAAPDGSNSKSVAGGTDSLEKSLPSESADASDGTNKTAKPLETAAIDNASTPATAGINSDALTLDNADTSAASSRSDNSTRNTPKEPTPEISAAPRSLGTLTFDANGNVINAGRPKFSDEKMTKLPGVFSDGVDGGVEAAEYGPTPSTVLKAGQIALKNNRLNRAEGAFRAFLKAWPKDPDIALAKTYLAQTLFQKQQYFDAANLFLDTHNAHPESRAGADNLLGLGLSLAGLNQREVACATYAEVLKQYPADAERLRDRVSTEQSAARC